MYEIAEDGYLCVIFGHPPTTMVDEGAELSICDQGDMGQSDRSSSPRDAGYFDSSYEARIKSGAGGIYYGAASGYRIPEVKYAQLPARAGAFGFRPVSYPAINSRAFRGGCGGDCYLARDERQRPHRVRRRGKINAFLFPHRWSARSNSSRWNVGPIDCPSYGVWRGKSTAWRFPARGANRRKSPGGTDWAD